MEPTNSKPIEMKVYSNHLSQFSLLNINLLYQFKLAGIGSDLQLGVVAVQYFELGMIVGEYI